jgi:hypothetical protein
MRPASTGTRAPGLPGAVSAVWRAVCGRHCVTNHLSPDPGRPPKGPCRATPNDSRPLPDAMRLAALPQRGGATAGGRPTAGRAATRAHAPPPRATGGAPATADLRAPVNGALEHLTDDVPLNLYGGKKAPFTGKVRRGGAAPAGSAARVGACDSLRAGAATARAPRPPPAAGPICARARPATPTCARRSSPSTTWAGATRCGGAGGRCAAVKACLTWGVEGELGAARTVTPPHPTPPHPTPPHPTHQERHVSHIVIETGGVPYVEGQAFGVIPPGTKVRRRWGWRPGAQVCRSRRRGCVPGCRPAETPTQHLTPSWRAPLDCLVSSPLALPPPPS